MPAGTTRLSRAASVLRTRGLTGVMVTVFGRTAAVARQDQVSLKIVQEFFLGKDYLCQSRLKTKTMFCGHHFFLNQDFRLKPCSVVIISNSDLSVNYVH